MIYAKNRLVMHPDNADFEILFERWMTFNDFVSFIAISWFVCWSMVISYRSGLLWE